MNASLEDILLNARKAAEGDAIAFYNRADYEEAMMQVATRATPPGGSTATTFAKLLDEGDRRITDLYAAARRADHQVADARAAARRAEVAAGQSYSSRSLRKAEIGERMSKHAATSARAGETEEQAFSRMLDTDATMQSLYEAYRGA